jgi:hypothetical protein
MFSCHGYVPGRLTGNSPALTLAPVLRQAFAPLKNFSQGFDGVVQPPRRIVLAKGIDDRVLGGYVQVVHFQDVVEFEGLHMVMGVGDSSDVCCWAMHKICCNLGSIVLVVRELYRERDVRC